MDVTEILSRIDRGDASAAEQLLPQIYNQLRRLAAARMAQERADHTLQATTLVHEAYVRLVNSDNAGAWDSRRHFFSAAAEAMRRILIDHARNSRRQKRGGQAEKLALDGIELVWKPQYGDILDLHNALEKLEAVDRQSAELVKLRCFAGQTQADSAALLGISRRTADRLWAFARAWLYDALK